MTRTVLEFATNRLLTTLPTHAYEQGREYAPGWDIYGLEVEWRAWLAKKSIVPRSPERHFLAFCKRRGRYPGFR